MNFYTIDCLDVLPADLSFHRRLALSNGGLRSHSDSAIIVSKIIINVKSYVVPFAGSCLWVMSEMKPQTSIASIYLSVIQSYYTLCLYV